MVWACSVDNEMNMSVVEPDSVFLVFVAIRRKITAANDRIYKGQRRVSQDHTLRHKSRKTAHAQLCLGRPEFALQVP